MFGDLQNPRWMYLKAALFIVLGCMSGGLLFVQSPSLRTLTLLLLTVWAFSRAYFFAFYVIENYIDGEYRFDGLWSVLRHVVRACRK